MCEKRFVVLESDLINFANTLEDYYNKGYTVQEDFYKTLLTNDGEVGSEIRVYVLEKSENIGNVCDEDEEDEPVFSMEDEDSDIE